MAKRPGTRRAGFDKAALELWARRSRAALVAVAHPDDAEIRFGATMLKLVDEGWSVYVLVATDGRASCVDPALPAAEVVRTRRSEQREAARMAGLSGVFFLDYPDGDLEFYKRPLKERLVYYLRKLRPSALYTYDPTTVYFSKKDYHLIGPFNHPDHRAVGEAALSAVYCGSPLARAYPSHARQGLGPWAVDEVYLAATERPNFRVDLKPYLERKRRLISVYRSQSGDTVQMTALESGERSMRRIDCSRPKEILELLR